MAIILNDSNIDLISKINEFFKEAEDAEDIKKLHRMVKLDPIYITEENPYTDVKRIRNPQLIIASEKFFSQLDDEPDISLDKLIGYLGNNYLPCPNGYTLLDRAIIRNFSCIEGYPIDSRIDNHDIHIINVQYFIIKPNNQELKYPALNSDRFQK